MGGFVGYVEREISTGGTVGAVFFGIFVGGSVGIFADFVISEFVGFVLVDDFRVGGDFLLTLFVGL